MNYQRVSYLIRFSRHSISSHSTGKTGILPSRTICASAGRRTRYVLPDTDQIINTALSSSNCETTASRQSFLQRKTRRAPVGNSPKVNCFCVTSKIETKKRKPIQFSLRFFNSLKTNGSLVFKRQVLLYFALFVDGVKPQTD